MKNQSVILLRFSAIFAVIGAFLGSHMAGAGSYAFRPIHAHILVVGWLSLFAFSVFYRVFNVKATKLATAHVWTAIIGSLGLTVGMWMHQMNPFHLPDGVVLILYIVGGSILLISFVLFLLLTFKTSETSK
ncbi:hypothetical protein H1Z61_06900 [Bacillus aquiflavi]|uniref:Cytochrome-c oxidase n=1 Tax=Bacillus aquiflavi TaxID=2672567 RepID=A0A6B3VW61_9BACI|nr:hypothetical protein [Bacillus aquiflavi]MBA4536875.1 hypothetical protein [Bacillus aquiflavi]NEY81242.1 hypothetical protein [Bacillus aquiflavi]UAC48451.1 hypothetical protein K6959_18530 [Bacillus aquiflavi]